MPRLKVDMLNTREKLGHLNEMEYFKKKDLVFKLNFHHFDALIDLGDMYAEAVTTKGTSNVQ